MNSRYMPRGIGATLGYLVEECGEVMAAVGKTQRWGVSGIDPTDAAVMVPDGESMRPETNREWILRELADLENAIALTKKALVRR